MKIEIVSKGMVNRMVNDATRREMNKIYDILNKIRERVIALEEKRQ